MAKRDFYDLLGVTTTATDAELKSAFRKAALQCHPDRNPGDKDAEAKFKEVNEAYQVLSDGQKRAAYDRFGHAAFEQGGGGGAGDGFPSSMADIFDDLFGDMMGRSRGRASGGRERGSDLRYNLEISLEDAFKGKTATVKMPISVACDNCSGSGAKPGSKPRTCATCAGHGRVRAQQGFFAIERTCPACGGRGEVIDNPCPACAGTRRSGRATAASGCRARSSTSPRTGASSPTSTAGPSAGPPSSSPPTPHRPSPSTCPPAASTGSTSPAGWPPPSTATPSDWC